MNIKKVEEQAILIHELASNLEHQNDCPAANRQYGWCVCGVTMLQNNIKALLEHLDVSSIEY